MSGNRKYQVDGKRVHRHYIREWAAHRALTQADISRLTDADRGTISRWFSGGRPGDKHLTALADALGAETRGLFMHPLDYAILRRIEPLTEDQKRRALELLELAFDQKANTPPK